MIVRLTVLLVLVCIVAFAFSACGSEELDPTPVPTVAPTPTATPVPPTPTPEPTPEPAADPAPSTGTGDAMTFDLPDLPANATGQDIVDKVLTEEEATCVRTSIGDDAYAVLLQTNVLDPSAELTGGQVLGPCLSKETAIVFFLTGMNAATGGVISDEALNCIGSGLLPLEVDLFAPEPDPSVMFAFLPCLSPEELGALTAAAPQ